MGLALDSTSKHLARKHLTPKHLAPEHLALKHLAPERATELTRPRREKAAASASPLRAAEAAGLAMRQEKR